MREVAGSPPDTRRTGGTISICQSAQTGSPRRSHDACAYRWNLCTPGNIRHPAARVPLTDPACFIIPRLPAGGVYFRRRSPAEKIATRPAQETKIYRRLGPLLLATMWSHIYIFPVCFFFFFPLLLIRQFCKRGNGSLNQFALDLRENCNFIEDLFLLSLFCFSFSFLLSRSVGKRRIRR